MLNNPCKQKGTALVIVLLFSSLLAVIILFSWNSALLQNQMAQNYTIQVLDLAKAEASLEAIQKHLVYNTNLGIHLQFVPDEPGGLSGVDYYQIFSDPSLKIRLKATVALYRDQNGEAQHLIRKTWEQICS